MKLNNTQRLTVSGIITALTAVLLILSNIITIGTYTVPAIAGIFILILYYVTDSSYALSSFAAVSVISFLFCNDKETVLYFILFFGYYPLLKKNIEKINIKLIKYIIKYIVFNSTTIIIYLILIYVLAVPQNFEIFGINLYVLFLFCFNIMFILYDYALTLFDRNYREKIKNIIFHILNR